MKERNFSGMNYSGVCAFYKYIAKITFSIARNVIMIGLLFNEKFP